MIPTFGLPSKLKRATTRKLRNKLVDVVWASRVTGSVTNYNGVDATFVCAQGGGRCFPVFANSSSSLPGTSPPQGAVFHFCFVRGI